MVGALAILPFVGQLFGSVANSQTNKALGEQQLLAQQSAVIGSNTLKNNDVFIMLGVFAVVGVGLYFALKK